MNLSSMLNDGPAPPKRSRSQASTPDGSRFMGLQHQPHSMPGSNGMPTAPRFPLSRPESHTPHYGPSSMTPGSAQSAGLTPLKTPSQTYSANQFPFPVQSSRASEPFSANTPVVARPPHEYQHPHPSPSHYGPGGPISTLRTASTTSLSSTPSSHPSHTPHSVRQSPHSAFSHTPGQVHPHHQYHASQPSTPQAAPPLGPPPPFIQRTSNPNELASPIHHHRTLSGASASMTMGSPAQHYPTTIHQGESPRTYNRPSSRGRHVSDYPPTNERERSVSVSPKTVIQPRPSSMSSRHSSQQDLQSARSSGQLNATNMPQPGQYSHVNTPTLPIHNSINSSHSPGEGANKPVQFSHAPPREVPPTGSNDNLTSRKAQTPIEHQSRKLGMDYLLSSSDQLNTQNGSADTTLPSRQPATEHLHAATRPEAASGSPTHTHQTYPSNTTVKTEEHGHPAPHQPSVAQHNSSAQARQPLKRAADFDNTSGPPVKREKRRKFQERPIWAQLSPQNQHSKKDGRQLKAGEIQSQPSVRSKQITTDTPIQRDPPNNGYSQASPQANGSTANMAPWQQNPPIDGDLVHMRKVLGPWEKSLKWHTPIPSLVAAVQDWLFENLEACADIGSDPLQGAIEIEAKIGTLISHENGLRCNLPVCSAVVIHPMANRNYRFESQMDATGHQKMNAYLNEITAAATQKGRVSVGYKHLRENDSFRTLSDIGLRSLPQTAHKRPFGRELKLRTTIDDETSKVKARIVKLPLADLHIFSPQDPYDCRISMNLEVNLNREGIDPDALTVQPTAEKPAPPDRHKNRVSYRHLAYTVDLTRVDVKGLAPKFELELELDANLLREQYHLVKTGAPNAFSNVVEGFIDNCSILMRHRA